MRLLIDTQIFIWFVTGAPELRQRVKDLLEEDASEVLLSMASLWEMSIKTASGKLQLRGAYENVMEDVERGNITILPITFAHTVQQHRLPFHHRDPFDRLIHAPVC